MKKTIALYLSLLIFCQISFAQILPDQLWMPTQSLDLETGWKDFRAQEFMSMTVDSSIICLYFKEYLNRETGDIFIAVLKDTVILSDKRFRQNDLLYDKNGNLNGPGFIHKIISLSDTSFVLKDSTILGKVSRGGLEKYKLLEEAQHRYKPEDLISTILGNDYEEYEGQDSIPNEQKIFFLKEDRQRHWTTETEKEQLEVTWEMFPLHTHYVVVDFNGFLLFKGVKSPPQIVVDIGEESVVLIEYDALPLKRKEIQWRKIN